MKKKTILLLMFMAFIFVLPTHGTASSYFVYDHFGARTWSDASKSFSSEDSLMCWAAAASNILAWGGWTTGPAQNADQIFTAFQNYWTNAGGNMYYGWAWWLDGTLPSSGSGSQVNVSGGGNYFPAAEIGNYFLGTGSDGFAMDAIRYLLQHGYGVTLGVVNASIAHAITVWGYAYTENGYQGIYITDSDDNISNILYYAVSSIGGKWYLQNYYGHNDIYIDMVEGLACNDTRTSSAVPIPATAFLLGSGLFGLVGIRCKRIGQMKRLRSGIIHDGDLIVQCPVIVNIAHTEDTCRT